MIFARENIQIQIDCTKKIECERTAIKVRGAEERLVTTEGESGVNP